MMLGKESGIILILLFIFIPISYAKTMDMAKEISVSDSRGSILINGSFNSIIKDIENITIIGYESGIIGNIRITTGVENIRLLNATSNSLSYTQYGADAHYIYVPSMGRPIIHNGTLISYLSHLSEISTIGVSNVLLLWVTSGVGLSVLIMVIMIGLISLFMALTISNKRRRQ